MEEIIQTEEEYFYKIFNTISESIITDEYFDKNDKLLSSISSSLYDINIITEGKMPPELGRRVIEEVFSNVFKHGIR
jgi:hypothetical protein